MARALLIGQGTILTAAVLKGWLASGNEVAEIWSAPRERLSQSQRTMRHWAPDWSVLQLARRHRIAVFENPPMRTWEGGIRRISDLRVDTLISAVTMQILPQAILDVFGARAVNFHPALLPHYRGPSPYLGTLLDGCENDRAGVTLHILSAGIDEGPMIAQLPVRFDDVGRSYPRWLVAHAVAAGSLAHNVLPAYLAGRLPTISQGAGSYRRVGEDAMIMGGRNLAKVSQILERIGMTGRVSVVLPDRKVRVLSIQRIAGPPTGAAPSIAPLGLSMDLADARVTLARWTLANDGLEKLELLRALRRADREKEP